MINLAKRIVGMFVITTFVVSFAGCSLLAGDPKNTKSPDEILAMAKKEIIENMKAEVAKNADKMKENNPFAILNKSKSEAKLDINLDSGDEGKVSISLNSTKNRDSKKSESLGMAPTYMDLITKSASDSNIKLDMSVEEKDNTMVIKADADTAMTDGVVFAKLNDLELPTEGPGAMPKEQLDVVKQTYVNKWFKLDLGGIIGKNDVLKQMLESRRFGMDYEKSIAIVEGYLNDVLGKYEFFEVDEESKKVTRDGAVYDLKITKANAKKLAEAHLDYLIKYWDDFMSQSFSTVSWSPQMSESAKAQIKMLRDNMKESDFENIVFKGTFANDKLKKIAYVYEKDDTNEVGKINFELNFEDDKHDLNYANAAFDLEFTPKSQDGKLILSAKINELKGGKRITSMDFDLKSRGTAPGAVDASFNMEIAMDQGAVEPDYVKVGMEILPPEGDSSGIEKMNISFAIEDGTFEGALTTVPKEKIEMKLNGTATDDRIQGKIDINVNMGENEKGKGDITFDYKVSDEDYTFELPEGTDEAEDITPMAEQFMMMGMMGLAGGMQPVPMSQSDTMMQVDPKDMQ